MVLRGPPEWADEGRVESFVLRSPHPRKQSQIWDYEAWFNSVEMERVTRSPGNTGPWAYLTQCQGREAAQGEGSIKSNINILHITLPAKSSSF